LLLSVVRTGFEAAHIFRRCLTCKLFVSNSMVSKLICTSSTIIASNQFRHLTMLPSFRAVTSLIDPLILLFGYDNRMFTIIRGQDRIRTCTNLKIQSPTTHVCSMFTEFPHSIRFFKGTYRTSTSFIT
jgi:hypothetical protein